MNQTKTLTIDAKEFRALVSPVLPMASKDDMLPSICAVLIETDGKWLSATATDRFRAGIKRIEKRATDDDPTTEWPEFRALVPTRAVRSLLSMFKPSRGTTQPATITMTVAVDEHGCLSLTAEAVGLFDLFDSGRFTHHLPDAAQFPLVRKVFKEALDTPEDARTTTVGVTPALLADFKAVGGDTLRVVLGGPGKSMFVTDDKGFIGLLMPRRLLGATSTGAPEDWSDFFAEKPKAKKSSSRKAGAA